MRGNSFSGSLIFAALAGLAALPFVMMVEPWFGGNAAASLIVLLSVAGYCAAIANTPRRAVGAALLAIALALPVWWLATSLETVAVAGAAILALCRGALLYRGKPGRTLVKELILLPVGLVAGALVFWPTALGLGVAIWAFFLVQSCFFLIGATQPTPATAPTNDPFQSACQRAVDLMERV